MSQASQAFTVFLSQLKPTIAEPIPLLWTASLLHSAYLDYPVCADLPSYNPTQVRQQATLCVTQAYVLVWTFFRSLLFVTEAYSHHGFSSLL